MELYLMHPISGQDSVSPLWSDTLPCRSCRAEEREAGGPECSQRNVQRETRAREKSPRGMSHNFTDAVNIMLWLNFSSLIKTQVC